MFGQKFVTVTYDILLGVNATVWGGVKSARKVGQIVKTGMSAADVVVGTSHALEDLQCQDFVCASLDIVGSLSSAVGMVIGNIPSTKHLTFITGSVTVGCRSVRFYCKRYGTFWGCSAAVGHVITKAIRFTVKDNH